MDMISTDSAKAWVASWDAQQATFFSDREERFQVVVDVLDHVLTTPAPLVVDLGCGPGSLARRVHDRLPDAHVVGVDMDPVLLGLARAAHGDWLALHQLDLREAGWVDRLGLVRRPDAFISSTALHWLDRPALEQVLTDAASALAPGGVVVDADHVPGGPDAPDGLAEEIGRRAVARGRRDESALGWQEWWAAIEGAPELAHLVTERGELDLSHEVLETAALEHYLGALRRGGCTAAGTVWQVGDDRVIVGTRA